MGREVFVWPNNDVEGFKAARDVCAELRKVGVHELEIASPKRLEKDFPDKWNLADPVTKNLRYHHFSDVLNRGLKKTRGIESASYDLNLNEDKKLDRFEVKSSFGGLKTRKTLIFVFRMLAR